MSLVIDKIEIQELRGLKIDGIKINVPVIQCNCVDIKKLEELIIKQNDSITELKEIVFSLTGRKLVDE